jgi:hypothetical protein
LNAQETGRSLPKAKGAMLTTKASNIAGTIM